MNRCRVSFERLADFIDGKLSDADSDAVRVHLDAGCAHCQPIFASLQRTTQAMVGADSVHAPEHVIQRASAIFRERFRRPERVSLIARLVMDTRQNAAPAGARGAETASMQFVYSTEAHDIDLWQERQETGNWYVIGQVLPKTGGEPFPLDSVTLVSPDGETSTADLEGGEFHLQAVREGVYELRMDVGDSQLVIPDMSVGS